MNSQQSVSEQLEDLADLLEDLEWHEDSVTWVRTRGREGEMPSDSAIRAFRREAIREGLYDAADWLLDQIDDEEEG